MQITKSQLKRIIQEELVKILQEDERQGAVTPRHSAVYKSPKDIRKEKVQAAYDRLAKAHPVTQFKGSIDPAAAKERILRKAAEEEVAASEHTDSK